ncbi:Triosephosphate isomerase [Xylariaceae sp. FL0804]|nr:Triosephosphate isomerase [Xylariaceae sp. FL0804]
MATPSATSTGSAAAAAAAAAASSSSSSLPPPPPPPPPPRWRPLRRRLIGMSTKMYFSAAQTHAWVASLQSLLNADDNSPNNNPNNNNNGLLDTLDIFIIPDHITLASVASTLAADPASSARVLVGAQDCSDADFGALTGEVSPAVLAEVGCALVEVGHAERRRLFGETDASAARKAAAAARNGMVPLLCVGERDAPPSLALAPPVPPAPAAPSSDDGGEQQQQQPDSDSDSAVAAAVSACLAQIRPVVALLPPGAPLVLAYEPVWAIGADAPAPAAYVAAVARGLRAELMADYGYGYHYGLAEEVRRGELRVLYGGSAGPGLFARGGGLASDVDGLFLGRFGHDPEQFFRTAREVADALIRWR